VNRGSRKPQFEKKGTADSGGRSKLGWEKYRRGSREEELIQKKKSRSLLGKKKVMAPLRGQGSGGNRRVVWIGTKESAHREPKFSSGIGKMGRGKNEKSGGVVSWGWGGLWLCGGRSPGRWTEGGRRMG